MRNFISLIIMAILMTGCASAPTEDDIRNADYGLEVTASSCISIAQRFIKNKMKDPNSAQFSGVQCYKGWEGNVPIVGVPATYGYRFVGEINARNSFGGYTGFSPFSGIVKNDGSGARVIRYCIISSTDEYKACIPKLIN